MSTFQHSLSAKRSISLSVIFLTLYIDLIGFSIIFPLGPDLLTHYLAVDGHTGVLGWLVQRLNSFAYLLGKNESFLPILFGGLVSSVFSILQFLFSPFWGGISDRHGRRPVLVLTVAGTALGYILWAVSNSFWLFLVSRIVSGTFSGNLSVATAAVADVTTREERSKAMGLVGAAFGLGLVTGPMLGAFTAHINLLASHPTWAHYGINPFSVPATIAFVLCLVNLGWTSVRFKETISPTASAKSRKPSLRNPIAAIFGLHNPAVRRMNLITFTFSVAFVSMETSLTFLAAERFNYTASQSGYLLGFFGICAIITQGYIIRKLLKKKCETFIMKSGLVSSSVGLLCIGFAPCPGFLYSGLAALALGSGLVNTSASGLISLYSEAAEQGLVLGIFRSLGSLSRATTPLIAGTVFWIFGSRSAFMIAALFSFAALVLSHSLPTPRK